MSVRRVPFRADEKETLLVALDRHRDVVLWKLEGLSEEQLRRPMVPSGLSMLTLLKHLASVEFGWFCLTFGRPAEIVYDPDDPEADMRLEPDETAADVVAYYERARAAANQAVAEMDLEDLGTSWFGAQVTLRWVLVHMVEEVCRHCGHLDIMRELIDGATGQLPEMEDPG